MQSGDAVTITGRVKCVHGTPETHAPELCSVEVEIPGGQTLWVNRGNVELAARSSQLAADAEASASAKPRRGRHTKHVADVETPGDNPPSEPRAASSEPGA
jgi:hypothetical protein